MSVYTFEYRITPARLDMMIVVARDRRGIGQNVLRDVLDVCPAVVSRMLDSLEVLGYVVRSEHPTDRRVNWVRLTRLGKLLLAEITKQLLLEGFTEHGVRGILSRGRRGAAERVLARTRRFLTHLRGRLFDGSTHVYPGYLATGERSPLYPYRYEDHVPPWIDPGATREAAP